LKKLGKYIVPADAASLVGSCLSKLADAQVDLQIAGLNLAPLPYDEALSLTTAGRSVDKRVTSADCIGHRPSSTSLDPCG
jgi:hypothetical protein